MAAGAARLRPPASSPLPLTRSGVSGDALVNVAACTESYEPHTVAIAIPQPAYSTKIVSTRSSSNVTIGQRSSNSRNSQITRTHHSASTVSTRLTTTVASKQQSSIATSTKKLTQPTTVSLTGPRQTPPLNSTAQHQLRESTHFDTAECRKEPSSHCHRETIRMVWPADAALYDWSHDSQQHAWDGQPIPIDDVDHVFDPTHYSNPLDPLPQQQQQPQYPHLEQEQAWSGHDMDALIEQSIGELDDFEGFDLDELDNLLGEGERGAEEQNRGGALVPAEEEPLSEFFPMLGSSIGAASTSSMAPSGSTPPVYHDMTAGYQTTTTQQTTTLAYGSDLGCGSDGWVRMGAPDGRIDRSPTFMDTGCDLYMYLNDWYDEPSTSRSSPDYDAHQLQPYPSQEQQHTPSPPSTMTASTTTTRRTTTTVRYAPYASARTRTPAKRAPVFRPEGFGTPAIGENAAEYRKKRDKNNISSARSRAKKAEALKEMKVEAIQLEKKNIELKAVLDGLEREVAYYKELMMTALSK